MIKPLISVVLATFNAGKTLQLCLDSFRAQNYTAKELVLIDGGSSDNTKAIIAANTDILSYWESAPDGGIYNAWNKALTHINGDWLYFIGADDRFSSPDVLSSAAPLLQASFPAHRVAYGRVDLVNQAGRVWMTAGGPWDRKKFLQAMSIPHQGVFQHKSLFAEYGHFDESYRIGGDYEFLLRELKDKDALYFSSLRVAAMAYGGVSSNPMNSLKVLSEISRARRKHGVSGFPFHLYWAYFKAVFRVVCVVLLGESWAGKAANYYRMLVGRKII